MILHIHVFTKIRLQLTIWEISFTLDTWMSAALT